MNNNQKLALLIILGIVANILLQVLLLGVFSIVFSKVSSCNLRNFLVYMWCFASIVSPIYCAILVGALNKKHDN